MNLSSLLTSLVVASGGEANLKLPDLGAERFLGGAISGSALLAIGLLVSAAGLVFGLSTSTRLKNLPVHRSMLEISELIYETAKTYLMTQFKFIAVLWAFIAVIIVAYFGFLTEGFTAGKVAIILAFSVVGILGSSGVAWFGIRVNTYANSRTAFASLRGKPFPTYAIPLQAGMSIGTMLISVELLIMLFILLFMGDIAGPCFIGFAIGESLGASALRIAGGIFTKIADIGSDLMKIVFKIKEDDARNPGVIADCTGDNAGDSVGPSADGFETYGVTGVALISFILLAVAPAAIQTQLLVWIFAMRIMMVIASVASYWINEAVAKARYLAADHMDFEAPLTSLVWLTSLVSVVLTFLVSYLLIPSLNGDTTLWWKLSAIITCGTLAGAIIPEMVKVFTSTNSRHVREVVKASEEGGASLNVLAGLTAGNFSAFWLGLVMAVLMGIAYLVSKTTGFNLIMAAPAVFAFGLVAFGFLGMGPVTIAVDSYGPVTDNAQSVYELSLIENIKGIKDEVKKDFGFEPNFEKGKEFLEENDGAGNTFKATAKPVLIGTAVVGATTMIFSIIVTIAKMNSGVHAVEGAPLDLRALQALLDGVAGHFSILEPMFLLGLLLGGSVIYWFSGASTQAVSTGAYRAVEFIKKNMKLDSGAERASVEDSKKVVEICTVYAQKGMWNIFMVVFFATLSFAFLDEYFFIGYLISIAFFGLFQALFMANAGGAWDNAKKIVETELKAKGTPLHDACVVGDTVGDPFKDTSSVAMNPVIKFTTLFGLLAVELALQMTAGGQGPLRIALSLVFLAVALVFVYRSFYGMRIESNVKGS
jgi:K(+)-stimulated pyrophosphate-energized sodium pump